MNTKSTLSACALFACLTLPAQAGAGSSLSDVARSVASAGQAAVSARSAERASNPAPVGSEPSTYALMALGLGVIGFAKRRRQSRAD